MYCFTHTLASFINNISPTARPPSAVKRKEIKFEERCCCAEALSDELPRRFFSLPFLFSSCLRIYLTDEPRMAEVNRERKRWRTDGNLKQFQKWLQFLWWISKRRWIKCVARCSTVGISLHFPGRKDEGAFPLLHARGDVEEAQVKRRGRRERGFLSSWKFVFIKSGNVREGHVLSKYYDYRDDKSLCWACSSSKKCLGGIFSLISCCCFCRDR